MHHNKHRKLLASDVDMALKWQDSQPLYGYGGVDSPQMQHVAEARVFVPEEKLVDLPALALEDEEVVATQRSPLTLQGLGSQLLNQEYPMSFNYVVIKMPSCPTVNRSTINPIYYRKQCIM